MASAKPANPLSIVRSPLLDVGGVELLTGLRNALAWLQANQEQANDLNVFPVPDGDTGSNMYLTLRSAVEEAQRAAQPASAASVMNAAAHGSLMGARGNSGVILSQVLRGFAQCLDGRVRVNTAMVAAALMEASKVADKAVMKPTEGTILTVVRDAAGAASAASAESEDGGDLRAVLSRAVREAHAAVERTTDQLAVLKEAGVVDAGGFGFAVILEGFALAIADLDLDRSGFSSPRRRAGEPRVRLPGEAMNESEQGRPARGAAAVAVRPGGWGYCTEFLVEGPGLDVDALRELLVPHGDSALVVGDENLVRVHIHTHDAPALIAVAAQYGRLAKLKVEDMSAQHHEVLARADAAETTATAATRPADPDTAGAQAGSPPGSPESNEARGSGRSAGSGAAPRAAHPAPTPPRVRLPLAVVPVAPGTGFPGILRSLGAEQVVEGGQTMNPSTEDLLNAVREANADVVILLPNNGNVILTAHQVDALAGDVDVRVVATRNLPQGISALLTFDADASVDETIRRMEAAAGQVRAVEITRAVRDSTANGHHIKVGDVLGLVDDEITHVGDDDTEVVKGVFRNFAQSPDIVTVYRGAGITEEAASKLVSALVKEYPGIEFELQDGGQEHYSYVLSVE